VPKIPLSVLMFHLRFYPKIFSYITNNLIVISVDSTELPLHKNLKYNYAYNV